MQILEMRTESPEILGSLATMSSFYEDNTPAARRQLCATIEKQGLSITHRYLQSAEHIVQVQVLKLSRTESCCAVDSSRRGLHMPMFDAVTCRCRGAAQPHSCKQLP